MQDTKKDCDTQIVLDGYLVFLQRFTGSKSSRLFPKLIPFNGGSEIWLQHRNDDSYNHTTLRSWQRQCAHVTGQINSEGTFIIDDISPAKDPLKFDA